MNVERVYLSDNNLHGSENDFLVKTFDDVLAYLMDTNRPAREYVVVKYYSNHGFDYASRTFRAWFNDADAVRKGDHFEHSWERSQESNAKRIWAVIAEDMSTDAHFHNEVEYLTPMTKNWWTY